MGGHTLYIGRPQPDEEMPLVASPSGAQVRYILPGRALVWIGYLHIEFSALVEKQEIK